MVLDMNLKLEGVDDEFLDDLDELIEETRVEYFIINPNNMDELKKTQEICSNYERIKYTLPIELRDNIDENCMALKLSHATDIEYVNNTPVMIDSKNLNDEFIKILNGTDLKGVVLNTKESDNRLKNFSYAISQDSLKNWSKKELTDTDFNKIALQSDYPTNSYDDLFDVLLKDISDLTFRAEQTIAAGGTRTLLKTFELL